MLVRFSIKDRSPEDFPELHPWVLGFLEDRVAHIEQDDYDEMDMTSPDTHLDLTFRINDAWSVTVNGISAYHLTEVKDEVLEAAAKTFMEPDIREIAEEMEREDILPNIYYIESEGDNRVRVDYGFDRSLFLNSDKTVDGDMPTILRMKTKLRAFLESKGFKVPAQDWT